MKKTIISILLFSFSLLSLHVHAHEDAFAHAFARARTPACTCTSARTDARVHTPLYAYMGTRAHTDTSMLPRACTHTCMHACIQGDLRHVFFSADRNTYNPDLRLNKPTG